MTLGKRHTQCWVKSVVLGGALVLGTIESLQATPGPGSNSLKPSNIMTGALQGWQIETGQIKNERMANFLKIEQIETGQIVKKASDYPKIGSLERFANALRLDYLAYAKEALQQDDFDTSNFLVSRAEILAEGHLPTALDPVAENAAMIEASTKLAKLYKADIRQIAPAEAAQAQATYDCWVSASAFEASKASAERCSQRALRALDFLQNKLDKTIKAVAATPQPPAENPFTKPKQPKPAQDQTKAENKPLVIGKPAQSEAESAPKVVQLDKPEASASSKTSTPSQPLARPLGAPPLAPGPRMARMMAPAGRGDQGLHSHDALSVFFAFNSTELTAQTRQQLRQAAHIAQQNRRNMHIVLRGHADRAGPEAYNIGLSARRAKRVQDYLRYTLGVEAGFKIHALGEAEPAIATPDGVREPRNRRVEIKLR